MFWSEKPKFHSLRLHPADEKAIMEVAEILRDRLQGLEDRIEALEAEVAALKKEPRQSFRAKLREKGITT